MNSESNVESNFESNFESNVESAWSSMIPIDTTPLDVQAENTANFHSAVGREQDDTDNVVHHMLRNKVKHLESKYDELKRKAMEYVDAYQTVKKKAMTVVKKSHDMVKKSHDDFDELQKTVLALQEIVKQQSDVIAAFSHGVGNVEVKLEEGVTTPAKIVGYGR